MWRINLIFDNGDEEDSGEEYRTKKEALEEAESYLDNWSAGADALELAGEPYDSRDLINAEVYKDK